MVEEISGNEAESEEIWEPYKQEKALSEPLLKLPNLKISDSNLDKPLTEIDIEQSVYHVSQP